LTVDAEKAEPDRSGSHVEGRAVASAAAEPSAQVPEA
jgi:hypothetical protein